MYSFNEKAHLVSSIFKVCMVIMLIGVVSLTSSLTSSKISNAQEVEMVTEK